MIYLVNRENLQTLKWSFTAKALYIMRAFYYLFIIIVGCGIIPSKLSAQYYQQVPQQSPYGNQQFQNPYNQQAPRQGQFQAPAQQQPPRQAPPAQTAPSQQGQASPKDDKASGIKHMRGVRLNLQFGYLYGEVHELVMAEAGASFPIDSQLDWTMKHTLTTGVNFEVSLASIFFKLNVGVPLTLVESDMVDRDWLFDNPPGGGGPITGLPASAPSHYSFSKTKNEFSINAHTAFGFNLIQKEAPVRFDIGLSFLYMTWAWRATDTQGLYFLDGSGVFGGFRPLPSSGDTVRYRIHYLVPALNIHFAAIWGIYEMDLFLNYSPMAMFFDRDEHVVTNVTSLGFALLGQMAWGRITNRFWITEKIALELGVGGKVLFRANIGSLTQTDNSTGNVTTTANAAGSEYFDIEGFIGVTLEL